jgi:hypothetical protein
MTMRAVAGVALGVLIALSSGVRAARASVSIPVTFDDLVRRATAAAVVTPLEQRGVWEGGRIATYTYVRVDRTVAGRVAGEVWVRTHGGAVGHIGQIVEGEATFAIGKASLVFLHPQGSGSSPGTFGVVEGAQGQFLIVTGGRSSPRLGASTGLGGLVSPASAQPLARNVLLDVALDDAASAIAAAWPREHAASEELP